MKRRNLIALLVTMLILSGNVCAQSLKEHRLTQSDELMLKKRVAEKVAQLNDYIKYMVSPKIKIDNRYVYKKEAQGLFINECKGYTEYVKYKDGTQRQVQRGGVKMETATLRHRVPRSELMTNYFQGLINKQYASVDIQSTEADYMRVSKLQPYGRDKDGNLLYACSVYFDQAYVARRGDGQFYKDITHKWAVCYIHVADIYDPNTGENYNEYMVELGDIYVVSVEKMK